MCKKILIIDDDLDDRHIIRRVLENLGYQVLEAETGEQGIELAKEQKPDIIITDTSMTGMDGFETCRRIKEIKDCEAKVIICTGMIDAVDASKAKEMGADDYCVKTVDNQNLIDAVKNLLN